MSITNRNSNKIKTRKKYKNRQQRKKVKFASKKLKSSQNKEQRGGMHLVKAAKEAQKKEKYRQFLEEQKNQINAVVEAAKIFSNKENQTREDALGFLNVAYLDGYTPPTNTNTSVLINMATKQANAIILEYDGDSNSLSNDYSDSNSLHSYNSDFSQYSEFSDNGWPALAKVAGVKYNERNNNNNSVHNFNSSSYLCDWANPNSQENVLLKGQMHAEESSTLLDDPIYFLYLKNITVSYSKFDKKK